MGLFSFLRRPARRVRGAARPNHPRRCRFEQMEPRELLAADFPLWVGAVYHEPGDGLDKAGNLFEVTFQGGAVESRLTRLVIDTDKLGTGRLDPGDAFFHTEEEFGAFGWLPLSIVSADGFTVTSQFVENGGSELVLTFDGFTAGDKLVFQIDVDELQEDGVVNAIVEGAEFEGSWFRALFTAPHYHDVEAEGQFFDLYDGHLAAAQQSLPEGQPLDLPPENYMPPSATPRTVFTAGAVFSVEQTPLPITIAGTVFEDVNLDNARQPGEPGIAGVHLSLEQLVNGDYVATGKTAITDGNGEYAFESVLPGTYRIVQTQPAGYFSVGATAGTVDGDTRGYVVGTDVIAGIALLGGEDSLGNDFAEALPATLSGYVYHDANDNGQFDSGEEGIGGVLLDVYQVLPDGTTGAHYQVHTDATGYWSVDGLFPGEYRVEQVQPDGWLNGRASVGTQGGVADSDADTISGIVLLSGALGAQYNFGELLPGTISGQVFVDHDHSGSYTPGEPLLAGVTIYLLDAEGNRIGSTLTDGDGQYAFTGLRPGAYGVEQIQPEGYFQGSTIVGSAGGVVVEDDVIGAIEITSGLSGLNYDFAELAPVAISGYVYVDANNNGLREEGERGIGGVKLTLLDEAGQSLGVSVYTDSSGYYVFDGLRPGTYGVYQTQPEGYFNGRVTAGTKGGVAHNPGDRITGVTLTSGQEGFEYNFGELEPGEISGQVFVDHDHSGSYTPGEPLLAGVTIYLLDAEGNRIGSTLTDGDGQYAFTGLRPGAYGVEQVQPEGYFQGSTIVGSAGGVVVEDDVIGAIEITSGLSGLNYDFAELAPVAISGYVYVDANNNGLRETGERGIEGVRITLLDEAGQSLGASVYTDSSGYYVFDGLRPGTYGVYQTQPEGYFNGLVTAGTKGGVAHNPGDRITGVTLTSGQAGLDYNFAELEPARLSGYVFQDGGTLVLDEGDAVPPVHTVRDGVRRDGSKPLAGVRLQLGDEFGNPILDDAGQPVSTVTDAAGYYEFTFLAAGGYSVLQFQPQGYLDGIDTPGTHGGVALNPHEAIAPDLLARLAPTVPPTDAIVGIFIDYGDDARGYNFSEVLVEFVPPPPPPTPPPPDPYPWTPLSPPPSVTSTDPNAYPIGITTTSLSPTGLWPSYGGGGGYGEPSSYSWHLSVVNAGQPRREGDSAALARAGREATVRLVSRGELGEALDEGRWVFVDGSGRTVRTFHFGARGALPIVGDFSGDGRFEIGVFIDGQWFIDLSGNGVWDEGDLWAQLGDAGDQPVVGDWDGDGKADIGTFGPSWPGDARAIAAEPGLPTVANRSRGGFKNLPPRPTEAASGDRQLRRVSDGPLRRDLIDHVFAYGQPGDRAVAGDWNGDGVATIGIFRAGTWYLDVNGNGRLDDADIVALFGREGDVPVVGDFTGDGVANIGVFRNGKWILDTGGNHREDATDKVFELGGPGDVPVVGDVTGDGQLEFGVFQPGAPPPSHRAAR